MLVTSMMHHFGSDDVQNKGSSCRRFPIVLEIEKKYLRESVASNFTASRAVARKVRPGLIFLAFGLSSGAGEKCCRAIRADADLRTVPVMPGAPDGKKKG